MWYTYRGFLRGRWCQNQRYKKPIVIVWVPWGANCDGDLCAVGLLGVVLGETLLMGRGIQDCAERGWMPMQLQLSPQPYSRGAPGWGDSFEMPWTEVRGPSFCNCLLTGDWVGSSFPQLRVISEEWWSPLQWARVQTLAGELKSCTLCGHKQWIIQPEAGGMCVSVLKGGAGAQPVCYSDLPALYSLPENDSLRSPRWTLPPIRACSLRTGTDTTSFLYYAFWVPQLQPALCLSRQFT